MRRDNFEIIKEALDIMGLPSFITIDELKSRYKHLAKIYHPDKSEDKEKMIKINAAYEILKNYMINFKFSFDEEEIYKQFPEDAHASKFRF